MNIDFEPVPASLRSQFTAFIRELKAGLVNAGVPSYLTVSTMAGAAAWSTGYDVVGLTAPGARGRPHGHGIRLPLVRLGTRRRRCPDREQLHLCLRGRDPRSPGARSRQQADLGRAVLRPCLEHDDRGPQLDRSARRRSSVAFSYYWTDNGAPAGGKILAERFGRQWDPIGHVPWFAFWDAGSNGYRQGYYDDPTSLHIKYDVVRGNGLAGIGIWHLGMDTGVPDLWNLIRDRFVKVIDRLAGADRYTTAANVSFATFAPGVPAAYVATGSELPRCAGGRPDRSPSRRAGAAHRRQLAAHRHGQRARPPAPPDHLCPRRTGRGERRRARRATWLRDQRDGHAAVGRGPLRDRRRSERSELHSWGADRVRRDGRQLP